MMKEAEIQLRIDAQKHDDEARNYMRAKLEYQERVTAIVSEQDGPITQSSRSDIRIELDSLLEAIDTLKRAYLKSLKESDRCLRKAERMRKRRAR